MNLSSAQRTTKYDETVKAIRRQKSRSIWLRGLFPRLLFSGVAQMHYADALVLLSRCQPLFSDVNQGQFWGGQSNMPQVLDKGKAYIVRCL
jgi:hypothetical protein